MEHEANDDRTAAIVFDVGQHGQANGQGFLGGNKNQGFVVSRPRTQHFTGLSIDGQQQMEQRNTGQDYSVLSNT